ncbi:hypothetical protein BU23DRAFT_546988 [Bimuria novae-zelandiae CBS 107.79]|uniref:Uncharacterized protein n=1 Tax=Bimuria novae-zelandiae CBS 107.79 TaxID=1447943 RepID=A0A6A5ULM2_9PLEO|nr:hypothetical protein BU23DRAFT_546988 [Bimuria novae-zelandiae CBS 107.79]
MAKKRTKDGKEKPSKAAHDSAHVSLDPAPSNEIPPGAQAPKSSCAPSAGQLPQDPPRNNKKQKPDKPRPAPSVPKIVQQAPSRKEQRKKLPKLPPNASISKRPLHHPALPTPFASASAPKTLYISHNTSFVPTLKRIRRLLLEISKRQAQSHNPRNRQKRRARKPLEANGRLAPNDVEREIAEAGREEQGIGGEEVFVKATGRAIERALRIGVYFQGESDCRVRVEIGSVMAVDDIEVREGEGGGDKAEEVTQDNDEEIPETRIRIVSSVTVAIGLK